MKNKKIIIGALGGITVIITLLFLLIINKNNNNNILSNNDIKLDPNTFAIMLETDVDTGEYEQSTSSRWPSSGYIYNENLSYCENGSTLTWNEETNAINLSTGIADKCYLYFDVILPPDVTINTNNIDNSYSFSTSASLSCTGATAEYNQKYQRIEISQINRYTSCNLTYEQPSSTTYLNNYIIGLSGTTQGTGQVVNENGYRYEGKDPNNYIWFNNELWRIIGVFDEATHEVSGQNLVKIIRANSIGGLAWHKSNTNDWKASSLMNLLNGAYYNSQNGTGGEYCYGYSTTTPGNCDYTESGINDTYRPMIENVTWHLGGYSSTSATTEAFYGYERGTTVSSGRPTTATGYIGLMYPSDYGYSVLSSSCARTTNLGDYDTATCAGQSWLYGQGYEWTITPYSSGSVNVFFLSYSGNLNNDIAVRGYSVRPVLYLDSSVYVIDGNGSISDPYIIAD